MSDNIDKLKKLREPFPENHISKLPKGTRAQNECQPSEKINCSICGGWHHPRIIHLDYVGHAALTNRLLDVDPEWNWEPVAWNDRGEPAVDAYGGMWIKLTVCGVTRLGYGDSQGKPPGGNAVKERIGDALRNAAMRFGAALDLWHKGDLHIEDISPEKTLDDYRKIMNEAKSKEDKALAWDTVPEHIKIIFAQEKADKKAAIEAKKQGAAA